MGSSLSSAQWTALSVICGVFFLIFDAARAFAQQVSPVTLRRWSGDPEVERSSRWLHSDPRNLQLISVSLLQIALVLAFASTVMATGKPLSESCLYAAIIWLAVAILWKYAVALVPIDVGEWILHRLIPFTHFFYYMFWPVLFPMRRMFARLDRQDEEEADTETAVTDEEVQAFIDV